jgi:gas vesicle protein
MLGIMYRYGSMTHGVWRWALTLVSLILLLFSLFLISLGPEVRIFEEKVPKLVQRSQTLFSGSDLLIPAWGYRYSGPYRLDVGKILKVSWEADTSVNVYVLNDVDWQNRFFGTPTRWRKFGSGRSGFLEFYINYNEPIYIQVLCPTWCSAKLYRWDEKVEWEENVIETQTKTNVQTTQVTYGYVLALISGALFVAGVILTITPIGGLYKKEGLKLRSYREYLDNLKQLKIQMNLLRTMYEKGEIDENTYQRLANEIDDKISSLRNIITQERNACEKEMRGLEEKISALKKRFEELMVRRRIGLIDKNAFEREMKQIKKELEDMKSKREYFKSLLESLTFEEI